MIIAKIKIEHNDLTYTIINSVKNMMDLDSNNWIFQGDNNDDVINEKEEILKNSEIYINNSSSSQDPSSLMSSNSPVRGKNEGR